MVQMKVFKSLSSLVIGTTAMTLLHLLKSVGLFVALSLLVVVVTPGAVVATAETSPNNDPNTVEYWYSIIEELGSNDVRLFRWDASEETVNKQLEERLCGKSVLEQAFRIIMDNDKRLQYQKTMNSSNNEVIHKHLELVARTLDYITWCVTDNPTNRGIFASQAGIQKSILDWIDTLLLNTTNTTGIFVNDDAIVERSIISTIGHVIYITTFANPINHQEYIKNGVVSKLSNIVQLTAYKSTTSIEAIENESEQFHIPYPIVTMWSLAALSNLAASYCSTEDDGRCYWTWEENGPLVLDPESHSITSDAATVRQEIIRNSALFDVLLEMSCLGPYTGPHHLEEEHHDQVSVGVDAEINRDEDASQIVVWAAASVLKNVAIDKESYPLLEEHITCFCQLSNSPDWLEENKGAGVLYHLRRGYPCHFAEAHSEEEDEHGNTFLGHSLCVDHIFYHEEHYTCTDLDNDPLDHECDVVDRFGTAATNACCACGGGTIVTTVPSDEHEPIHEEEEGDEEEGEEREEGDEHDEYEEEL